MPKRTKGPEALTQALICDYLTAKRVWWMRMNTGAVRAEYNGKTRMIRYGRAGCADLLAILSAGPVSAQQVVWIEVKHKTKQTDDQKAFENEVNEQGHFYVLACTLEDVMEVVK